MNIELYFNELLLKYGQIHDIPKRFAQQVVEGLECVWKERRIEDLPHICRWAAAFLGCPEISDEIWLWVIDKAKIADENERISWTIGVFEILADPPKEGKWLKLLFSLLKEPALAWIFLEIYETRPSEFFEDFQRVAELTQSKRVGS